MTVQIRARSVSTFRLDFTWDCACAANHKPARAAVYQCGAGGAHAAKTSGLG